MLEKKLTKKWIPSKLTVQLLRRPNVISSDVKSIAGYPVVLDKREPQTTGSIAGECCEWRTGNVPGSSSEQSAISINFNFWAWFSLLWFLMQKCAKDFCFVFLFFVLAEPKGKIQNQLILENFNYLPK